MQDTQTDFLIIGQGLAGSMLAFELINKGKTVMVIDDAHYGSSSKVAAGIINPITGHRLNLTSGFVDYFDRAKCFYKDAETQLSHSFIKSVPQIRLIKNKGQASYFEKRLAEPIYQGFLKLSDQSLVFKNTEYGCAQIKQTSIVDTKLLLREVRSWLTQKKAYRQDKIDYAKIDVTSTNVRYTDINAKKIVFCEGYQARNNPWLKDLPFKLAKGEILTVQTKTPTPNMLSWGNWLVPSDKGLFKLGSNYNWNLDWNLNSGRTELDTTESVKQKLFDSLALHTKAEKPNLIEHEVGIRPTTTDRNAFVGKIKTLENAFCFNGFGSKGCLTIPLHADLLCDHMLNNSVLPEELTKWL